MNFCNYLFITIHFQNISGSLALRKNIPAAFGEEIINSYKINCYSRRRRRRTFAGDEAANRTQQRETGCERDKARCANDVNAPSCRITHSCVFYSRKPPVFGQHVNRLCACGLLQSSSISLLYNGNSNDDETS